MQIWATGASVFKTLNTTGFGNMADPVFHGVKSVMFVAGDDAANKSKSHGEEVLGTILRRATARVQRKSKECQSTNTWERLLPELPLIATPIIPFMCRHDQKGKMRRFLETYLMRWLFGSMR